MKELERLFWAVGLLLLLPFAVQQGFKVNSPRHLDAPALQSTAMGISLGNKTPTLNWTPDDDSTLISDAAYQPSAFKMNQPLKRSADVLARLTVPALQIDLPVFDRQDKASTEHVEVITGSSDLGREEHIGLATCIGGDLDALAYRIRGTWLFLETESRLRQYRIVEARMVNSASPDLLPGLEFRSITLVNCLPAFDTRDHLLVITAIEVGANAVLHTASTDQHVPRLKF